MRHGIRPVSKSKNGETVGGKFCIICMPVTRLMLVQREAISTCTSFVCCCTMQVDVFISRRSLDRGVVERLLETGQVSRAEFKCGHAVLELLVPMSRSSLQNTSLQIAVTGSSYSDFHSSQIIHPFDLDKLFQAKFQSILLSIHPYVPFCILTVGMVLQVNKLLESRLMESQAESKDLLKQLPANAVNVQATNAAWEESEAARAVTTQVFYVC